MIGDVLLFVLAGIVIVTVVVFLVRYVAESFDDDEEETELYE